MAWRDWPKSYWIVGISLIVGIVWSFNNLSNFFLNLIILGNFDSFFLFGAFNEIILGFVYTTIPLVGLFALLDKRVSKNVKFGISGAFILSIIYWGLLALYIPIPIVYPIHMFYLSLFGNFLKGYWGTLSIILLIALVGFVLGILMGSIHAKIKSK